MAASTTTAAALKKSTHSAVKGWRAVLGCSYEALALFRICLGTLLTLELILRFRFLRPFYSDEGTLPLRLLMPKVDELYRAVCFHCQFGELWKQQVLLTMHVMLAVLYTMGWQTRLTAILTWYFYFSLTLRNTWMNYILDRYFHYLLFYSIFLPLNKRWSVGNRTQAMRSGLLISPATVAFKALVLWIYLDAGYGKYTDPLRGWSYQADPLPALDTYARHTRVAQYLYALLGPHGLRLLTPTVVYVELLVVPVALWGSYGGRKRLVSTAILLICSLHVGIALTLRNAALLSLVACTAWCVFLPIGWDESATSSSGTNGKKNYTVLGVMGTIMSFFAIASMVAGNLWLEWQSQVCDQSVKHIWSTLLHNRWNVFVGAEEYVTWEIAPGRLKDGTIVDVWGRRDDVSWDLPGGGAPCTGTARPGRWRSFPYLAGLEGEDSDALWSYLCREWDSENRVEQIAGRQLVKFNFFMLQADVLPNMAFSATRKRLIQTYECISSLTGKSPDAASHIPEDDEFHVPASSNLQSNSLGEVPEQHDEPENDEL